MSAKPKKYDEKKARRRDAVGALVVMALFHAALAVGFRLEPEAERYPSPPPHKVTMLDLSSTDSPEAAHMREFLTIHDPRWVFEGSEAFGYSSARLAPRTRPQPMAPQHIADPTVEDMRLFTGDAVITVPERPKYSLKPMLLESLLAQDAVVQTYPIVHVGGGDEGLAAALTERVAAMARNSAERVAALERNESIIEFDLSKKQAPPRVAVVATSGDAKLEGELVAALLAVPDMRAAGRRLVVSVRWKEETPL